MSTALAKMNLRIINRFRDTSGPIEKNINVLLTTTKEDTLQYLKQYSVRKWSPITVLIMVLAA